MRVTILVPVYNVERYMAECAKSLFSQTYPDIDYIFCDDGTPDASISVLQSVAARFPERRDRVTIIANDGNRGAGATRRRLIESVKTEAFAFVDADDCLPPTAVAALVQRMEQSGADIVDGTPIYDIKPYLAYTDSHPDAIGGFSDGVREYRAEVVFPKELLKKIDTGHREQLIRILEDDPRPSYKKGCEKEYGMKFAQYEIFFTSDESVITVTRVELI